MDLPDIYTSCAEPFDEDDFEDSSSGFGRRLLKKIVGSDGNSRYDQDRSVIPCEVSRHIFYYTISFGIAAHVLTIVLAMAFVNALNEAARDADVYRMFARGQGFLATVKVQQAFRLGAISNIIAMVIIGETYLGLEVVGLWTLLFGCVFAVYMPTSKRLFSTASIVSYWRSELGGKPDKGDPYELDVPIACFRQRLTAATLLEAASSSASARSETHEAVFGVSHEAGGDEAAGASTSRAADSPLPDHPGKRMLRAGLL